MILHLLRMRRGVNRNVFNDQKDVSVTAARENDYYRYLWTSGWPRHEWALFVCLYSKTLEGFELVDHSIYYET